MTSHQTLLEPLGQASVELCWEDCNQINEGLTSMDPASIPADLVNDVREYITNVLLWNSALPEHRSALEEILARLMADSLVEMNKGLDL
jgi:hypothetical protein